MGLLTAIRLRGRSRLFFEVREVDGARRRRVYRHETLEAARECAETLAARDGVVCTVKAVVDGRRQGALYTVRPDDDEWTDGNSGVREPRRPRPGSSAGSVALDLPD
jgi:hypothetical protein